MPRAPDPGGTALVEREVKLGAGQDFELPDLAALLPDATVGRPRRQRLVTVYHDTPDLRLLREGVTLRRRTGDGPVTWTVKLPERGGGAALVRREVAVVSRARTPPRELVRLVTAFVRSSPLEPVVELRTTRTVVDVATEGGEACEVADDVVEVMDGDDVTETFREVEVEARSSGDALVATVVDVLRSAGAGDPDPTSKAARALGGRVTEPPELAPVRVGKRSTLGEAATAGLLAAARLLVEHDHVIRLDDDPEGVHRARVGTRRLRALLKELDGVFEPEPAAALRDELHWLADELGAVRDADVLLERLAVLVCQLDDADRAAGMRLVQRLQDERDERFAVLRRTVDRARYRRLLERVVAFAASPPLADAADHSARSELPKLVGRRHRRLRHQIRALPRGVSDDDLHDVRRRAKRVRYVAEVAVPVIGRDAATYVRRLTDLQDVLGELHDTAVLRGWLRDAAITLADDAEAAFVAGELAQLEADRAAELRAGWRAVWRRADHAKRTRWLRR